MERKFINTKPAVQIYFTKYCKNSNSNMQTENILTLDVFGVNDQLSKGGRLETQVIEMSFD